MKWYTFKIIKEEELQLIAQKRFEDSFNYLGCYDITKFEWYMITCIDEDYSWSDNGMILTINYTLINSGITNLENVVVTFGADLTTDGNNDYGDPEDLSISIAPVSIYQNTSESGAVTKATGGLPVHAVGVIEIGLDNPPDDNLVKRIDTYFQNG